uniref:Uncharacterized protein n=1 Tax=Arion vulgaris TaxID=1028688 RepID=A0A0B7AQA3_9EUPU
MLGILALMRTSVSGILSSQFIFRSQLRQLVWKLFSKNYFFHYRSLQTTVTFNVAKICHLPGYDVIYEPRPLGMQVL